LWGTGAAIPIEVAKTPSARRDTLVELRAAWFKILTYMTRSSSVVRMGYSIESWGARMGVVQHVFAEMPNIYFLVPGGLSASRQ
jgi:hypothetical protein